MAFTYLTNTPLDKALPEYIRRLMENGFQAPEETLPVADADGRITARAVYAGICAPHYPACAMDGIALEARLSFGAAEASPVTLKPGQFTAVDTGDVLPQGCDAVVMIEDAVFGEDGSLKLYAPAAPWQHVRQVGEDICAGEMILPACREITPAAIGAMLAGGVSAVSVLRRPVVGLIPTGDEIVPPTAHPRPGDIIEFNTSIFSAMLRRWGAVPLACPIVPDDPAQIRAAVEAALARCDMVLLGAGSSAGREDYTALVISQTGEAVFHGLAIKPGKPAVLGLNGPKPVIGVPGYPVSGIVVLEQVVKPLMDIWYRRRNPRSNVPGLPTLSATLCRSVVSGLKYREFVRVRLGRVGERLIAAPLSRGAGMVTSFLKADGIIEIPQGVEGYEAGTEIRVRPLRPLEEITHSLMMIGSHDPLLDEAADLLHQADPELYMTSSHVGSMGGIMAVRRGEAHGAGIHLLDEGDGSYNLSYVKKYFPQGGVRLVECVGRSQGLMTAPGNPLGLTGVDSLTLPGLRYVNRQKGSGTRILIDYLCRLRGIDTAAIEGYGREEFTHTSVAAQIASGSADAGMGIFAAAQIYGLDFLPVCMEQYDLLIPDEAWDTPMVQRLMAVLQSAAFARRAAGLGGYQLGHPGEVRVRL